MNGLLSRADPDALAHLNARLWQQWSVRYPFHAVSPSKIDPSTVDQQTYGDFSAVVLNAGERTWGFLTRDARDLFVKRHDARAI